MSTPYPEIRADESGLVPAQPTVRSEWPKKLRALTQQDLDRLTIDQEGRFYWDGKLVTATTTLSGKTTSAGDTEPKALEMLDRAAMEIAGHRPALDAAPQSAKAVAEIKKGETSLPSAPTKSTEATKQAATAVRADRVERASSARRTTIAGKIRLSLSALQSLGGLVITLALLAGAAGLTATGWAAAHEWSCRLAVVSAKYCPADMAPKSPTRVNDIPT